MTRVSTTARILIGGTLSVAAVAGAVLVVGGGARIVPTVTGSIPAVTASVSAGVDELICDGPVVTTGRDATTPDAITVISDSLLTQGDPGGDEVALDEIPITGTDATVATLTTDGDDVPAGAVSVAVADGDVAGFAASGCTAASRETWLMGADTSLGMNGVLTIANPADVTAVVGITAYGVEGSAVPPGYDAVAIPARSVTTIPVASLTGMVGETASVRVVAQNTPVRASVQSSYVNTLDAAGIDVQTGTLPRTSQTIAGVVIPESGGDVAEPGGASLRLVAETDGQATVTILAEGTIEPVREPERVEVTADMPLAVDLSDLAPGNYSIQVSSTVEVAAATRTLTGTAGGDDYAWTSAAEDIDAAVAVAIPAGPSPRLHFANTTDEPTRVTVRMGNGTVRTVDVRAGESASVGVEENTVVDIDPGDGAVAASVSFADENRLGSVAVTADGVIDRDVVVYPQE